MNSVGQCPSNQVQDSTDKGRQRRVGKINRFKRVALWCEDGEKPQFHRGPCARFHHREIYSQALAWTVSDLMENTDG
jgi:hypothetical protein